MVERLNHCRMGLEILMKDVYGLGISGLALQAEVLHGELRGPVPCPKVCACQGRIEVEIRRQGC